jgi:hypothetical protein
LCKNCHEDFHNNYGRGDNTEQQFIEYINNLDKNIKKGDRL